MRRRRNATSVSFFAFQDIITAVMGILILVVLLLSLLVSQTVECREDIAENSQDTVSEITDAQLEQLRREVTSLQKRLDTKIQLLDEVARLESRDQIENKIQQQRRLLDSLNQAVSSQAASVAKLQSEVQIEEQELAAMERDLGVTESQKRADNLQSELESLKSSQRVTFNFRNLGNMTAWLVELRPDQIAIAQAGVAKKPIIYQGNTATQLARQFSTWLKIQSPSTTHIVLLLKPDSQAVYAQVKDMIDTAGPSVGVDLIGTDTVVIDPVKGAAL